MLLVKTLPLLFSVPLCWGPRKLLGLPVVLEQVVTLQRHDPLSAFFPVIGSAIFLWAPGAFHGLWAAPHLSVPGREEALLEQGFGVRPIQVCCCSAGALWQMPSGWFFLSHKMGVVLSREGEACGEGIKQRNQVQKASLCSHYMWPWTNDWIILSLSISPLWLGIRMVLTS